jgi:hypothetical protein
MFGVLAQMQMCTLSSMAAKGTLDRRRWQGRAATALSEGELFGSAVATAQVPGLLHAICANLQEE